MNRTKLPKIFPILHDDYHASIIGRLVDGRQFFVTEPFVPAIAPSAGREFIAVYLFTADGEFSEAIIDDLGTRDKLDIEKATLLRKKRIKELGELEFCNIKVAPFSIERYGVEFGFIPRPPDDEDDDWWVILVPGDYMAFTEPWDGEYDT